MSEILRFSRFADPLVNSIVYGSLPSCGKRVDKLIMFVFHRLPRWGEIGTNQLKEMLNIIQSLFFVFRIILEDKDQFATNKYTWDHMGDMKQSRGKNGEFSA